jgi:hypothetical protein
VDAELELLELPEVLERSVVDVACVVVEADDLELVEFR